MLLPTGALRVGYEQNKRVMLAPNRELHRRYTKTAGGAAQAKMRVTHAAFVSSMPSSWDGTQGSQF